MWLALLRSKMMRPGYQTCHTQLLLSVTWWCQWARAPWQSGICIPPGPSQKTCFLAPLGGGGVSRSSCAPFRAGDWCAEPPAECRAAFEKTKLAFRQPQTMSRFQRRAIIPQNPQIEPFVVLFQLKHDSRNVVPGRPTRACSQSKCGGGGSSRLSSAEKGIQETLGSV
jgi:hypothetical protein